MSLIFDIWALGFVLYFCIIIKAIKSPMLKDEMKAHLKMHGMTRCVFVAIFQSSIWFIRLPISIYRGIKLVNNN